MRKLLLRWIPAVTGVLLLTLLAAPACGGDEDADAGTGEEPTTAPAPQLEIAEPFARSPGTNNVGAVYFTVKNTGTVDDALVGASTAIAGEAQLHTTVMTDGAMKMQQVERIDVPAGGEAVLEPGGFHVMLMDLKQPLKEGDVVELTLTFEKSGTMTVQAEVVPYTQEGQGGNGMDQESMQHSGH